MKSLGRAVLVATALLLLPAFAFAQSDDQQFLSKAAQDGMAKIQWAYLALQNAQNPQVRLFAQQMLNDYGQAQNDLIYIANQQGVVLPRDLDPKDRQTFEALSQLHGAAFDKAYMKAMLNDPQMQPSGLKEEAAKANNPAIANWATKTLPTLQSDLKEAQKIAPAVGIHSPPTDKKQPAAGNAQPAGKPASPDAY